jgi:hypothetical protein
MKNNCKYKNGLGNAHPAPEEKWPGLTTRLHLVPKLKIRKSTPPLLHTWFLIKNRETRPFEPILHYEIFSMLPLLTSLGPVMFPCGNYFRYFSGNLHVFPNPEKNQSKNRKKLELRKTNIDFNDKNKIRAKRQSIFHP